MGKIQKIICIVLLSVFGLYLAWSIKPVKQFTNTIFSKNKSENSIIGFNDNVKALKDTISMKCLTKDGVTVDMDCSGATKCSSKDIESIISDIKNISIDEIASDPNKRKGKNWTITKIVIMYDQTNAIANNVIIYGNVF